MKPVVAMILAASLGGCLTGAEYFGRPTDSPPPAAPAEPEPASGPAKYDRSWHRTEYWAGEYPSGFTVDNDTTLSIRAAPEVGAPKSRSCALRKGATYHPWNKKRVAADHLKFVTFTRIKMYKLTGDYSSSFSRQPGDVSTTLNFKKGDRWSFLAGLSEGDFLMRFGGKTYMASQDLIGASDEVGGKSGEGGAQEWSTWNHEWMRLSCANGVAGWIFYNEMRRAPGFSSPEECGESCAEDRKPGGSSPDKLPSDKPSPGASSSGE